jgi:N-acetylglutamate synthase-like GNAT family acetyltransferase
MRRGMSTVSVRKMRKDDIASAGKIRKSITKRKAPRNWEKEIDVRLEDKENQCFVATSGRKVVGFIIGETKTLDFGVDKSGWLVEVAIDPDHMGSGIGKKLGKAMLNGFKKIGIKEVYTAARWDSTDLLSFFKSIGFERSEFINLERRMKK